MRVISTSEFLRKAASLKGDVRNIISIPSNEREGRIFELQNTPRVTPLRKYTFKYLMERRHDKLAFIAIFLMSFNLILT